MRTPTLIAGAASLLLVAAAATPAAADSAAATAMDSSVLIYAGDGLGAGFAVDGGRVVTAAHVVAGADRVEVRAADRSLTGTVVASDDRRDLAEVSVPGLDLPPLPLGDTPPAVGDQVFAIGAPLGDYLQASNGIVSAVVTQSGVRRVQTDAAVNPGNSGGPLVDADGAVVGVVVTKSAGGEGIGWATAASEVREFLGGESGASQATPQQPRDRNGSEARPPAQTDSDGYPPPMWPWLAAVAAMGVAAGALARSWSRRRQLPRQPTQLPPLDLTREVLPPLDLTTEDLTGRPTPALIPEPHRKEHHDQWI